MIIIAALAKSNRVMGKDQKLPWDIPDELQRFRDLTNGQTIIMGRKTFDSIFEIRGKPLPNRNNIVISRSMEPMEGVDVCRSVEEAMEAAKKYPDAVTYCIGGANIYGQMIPLSDTMYLSYVKGDYEGDTFFPEFNESEWTIIKKEEHEKYDFVVYERRQS